MPERFSGLMFYGYSNQIQHEGHTIKHNHHGLNLHFYQNHFQKFASLYLFHIYISILCSLRRRQTYQAAN